jgi:Na+-transporting NADH:ubiquinone oxidoreductase subunit B
MKPLRSFLDRMRPTFEQGGRFEKLYPLYEAIDTFFYTPGEVTRTASHVRDGLDLKRMMITVAVALIPCVYMACYNTGAQANTAIAAQELASVEGWRSACLTGLGLEHDPNCWGSNVVFGALFFLPIYIVTMTVGGLWEVLFGCMRGHDVNEGFLVTGLLLPLTLPATIPLWQVALAVSFGVVVGKEVFGGTGRNFLNPALTGRAFLYFAYPVQITGNAVWTAVDGFSGATILGQLAAADPATKMQSVTASVENGGLGVDWMQAFLGSIQGSMGETSTLACLIGATILIGTGIGSWKIMAGVIAGAEATSALLYSIGSDTNAMFAMAPHWHFVVGGFAFGTVFMATDPVSAAMTDTGKWFYGGLIGLMTILIRVVNPAFPEGIMLAILFGNVFAPLIDWCVVQANIKRRLARNET